ncbi:hypothetical protein BYT27DRAFT_7259161 [Phlegmacium glaucopus]|nr:hypothetical protein BYT27DRAFT_7259161 [Phlegmacium glaucopus]
MTAYQPAIGLDGQLLDTSKIEWYNDPDDAHPIQPTSNLSLQQGQCTCPMRTTQGTQLAAAIAAEKLDEFGNNAQPSRRQPRKSQTVAKRKQIVTDSDAGTDADNNNFAASSTEDGSDGDTASANSRISHSLS